MKQKEIRRLTWKYFLENKWEEIKVPLIILGVLAPICFIGYLGATADFELWNWQSRVLIIILGVIIVGGLTLWIKSNWTA